MSPEQLWNAALGELELELSKAKFVTWFENTFIIENGDGKIVIGVPNTFTKTWFENKYHSHIIKALRRISDQNICSVCYKVSARQGTGPLNQIKKEEVEITPPQIAKKMHISSGVFMVKEKTAEKLNTVYAEGLGLNPRYTFANFIVGKKNELAHAACLAVAEKPGLAYNPLFIYGGVGLGKTHLMQAVGHMIYVIHKNKKKILYVPCETFTNEYIEVVRKGKASQFHEKYRTVDLLMVDDVQFLAGKEGTQEAFFHTFNHLHQNNKQIVLTSDRPPRAIPTLEPRLFSRFEGGMIVDVSVPDLETRIAIIKQKCMEKGVVLGAEVAQFIASTFQNNIRELEGALNRVIAHHHLSNTKPTVESARELLSSFTHSAKHGAITGRKILRAVAEFFDIEEKDIIGNSRKKELVVPRQITMYLMREEMSASYPNIGQELGGRDHTTAMHSYQKITKAFNDDEKMHNDITLIKERLYN